VLTGVVFVGDTVLLHVGFDVARRRLDSLARGGALLTASQEAYGHGLTGSSRVGPLGPVLGVSRLVRVKLAEPVDHGDSLVVALRWEVIGPGGGLFPALDADITLAAAEETGTSLQLHGAYRPPLGAVGAGLDRAILHRVATATVRDFLGRLAAAVVNPAPAGAADADGRLGSALPPETEVS
jgi:hypothetical protein